MPSDLDATTRLVRALSSYALDTGQLRAGADAPSENATTLLVELVINATDLVPAREHAARQASTVQGWRRRWGASVLAKRDADREGFPPAEGAFGSSLERELTRLALGLASRGHLQTQEQLAKALRAVAGEEQAPKITTFVVPTANRPEALRRVLESYLANFEKHGRELRIVVGDDSADPSANRAILDELRSKRGANLELLDRTARARLLDERAGGDAKKREALAFLLQPDPSLGSTTGANRNALLLATAGELIFSADDDTLCAPHGPRAPLPGIALLGRGGEAQSLSRWPDRASAKAQLQPLDVDVLGAHERALARPLAAVIADALAAPGALLSGLDPDTHAALSTNQGRVALTVNGLFGDSASSLTPLLSLLEARGLEAQRILADPQTTQAIAQSREVVKLSSELRVGAFGPFMSTFYGLDNRQPLAYFPYFRRTDLSFRELLVRARPGATLAYLPVALEHAPVDVPKRELPVVAMSDVLLAALADVPPAPHGSSASELLRAVGHKLVSFAEQPLALYRRQVLEVVLEGRYKLLALRQAGAAMLPEPLASEARTQNDALAQSLAGPLVAADPALQRGRTPGEAEQKSRELVAAWGRALVALAS